MNILLLCDDYPSAFAGGTATATLNLARGLALLGHEVVLVWGEDPGHFPMQGVKQIQVKTKKRQIGNDHVLISSIPFGDVLGAWKPEIVHAQQPTPLALWGKWVAHTKKAKFIITLHNLLENVSLRHYRQIAKGAYRLAFALADGVVTPSEFANRYVKERFKPKCPVKTVSNSIDPEVFCAHLSLPLQSTPKAGIQVCAAISLVPYKNPEMLIRLWAKLGQLGVRAQLKIAGEGALRAPLSALAVSLGVAEQIEFLGALEHKDLANLMHQSDALLLSSRADNQPMVILEAKSVGTPSIVSVSPTSGAADLIEHGKTGLLFPIDELEAAAQIIAPYLLEPERLRAMRPTVLADAQRYTLQTVACSMTEFYRSL
ncbi:MAG: glycosyltransferase family 4 protein [Deinococcales bacterium]